MENIIAGKVVKVCDLNTVVINKGESDGIKPHNRFLLYELGEEIFDPDTGESLGILELVCGEGKPTHIQKNITTLSSDKFETKKSKTVVSRSSFMLNSVEETYEPETIQIPFEDVKVGTLVRQIK